MHTGGVISTNFGRLCHSREEKIDKMSRQTEKTVFINDIIGIEYPNELQLMAFEFDQENVKVFQVTRSS